MLYRLLIIFLLIAPMHLEVNAQGVRSHIRSGNRDMRGGAEGAASKAELKYRKAMASDDKNAQAMYNLGCALLAQNKDSMAYEMFEKATKVETSKQRKAMAYHNMGVIMQRQQQYGPAMEQYKQSLKLRPHDNQTRYNYVLCKKLKKDQDNNQNQNNQNNKNNQNKDKNKDQNKDQDKDKNKNKNDKDNKDRNKDNNQNQERPQDGQMSKENAEQLLNAAVQEEKATQQRLQKAMAKPSRRNIEKNW